jgi:uncharacterized protein YndB with AHSA1/START domain
MTTKSAKPLELTFERTIAAAPGEVFDAWLDSTIPGTPWHEHEKLIVNPKVDGIWYWLVRGNAHYGRFTEMERPGRLQLTWMSRHTLGEESLVTVTFQKKGDQTLLTLVHAGLPNDEAAEKHSKGWNFILDNVAAVFGNGEIRRK